MQSSFYSHQCTEANSWPLLQDCAFSLPDSGDAVSCPMRCFLTGGPGDIVLFSFFYLLYLLSLLASRSVSKSVFLAWNS